MNTHFLWFQGSHAGWLSAGSDGPLSSSPGYVWGAVFPAGSKPSTLHWPDPWKPQPVWYSAWELSDARNQLTVLMDVIVCIWILSMSPNVKSILFQSRFVLAWHSLFSTLDQKSRLKTDKNEHSCYWTKPQKSFCWNICVLVDRTVDFKCNIILQGLSYFNCIFVTFASFVYIFVCLPTWSLFVVYWYSIIACTKVLRGNNKSMKLCLKIPTLQYCVNIDWCKL